MFLVKVIPLQFPQTSLGFMISDCKSDCKISKNMFHHFYIFIIIHLFPILTGALHGKRGNDPLSPGDTAPSKSIPMIPNNLIPPKKRSHKTKNTSLTSLQQKNKIHWQVLHVMIRKNVILLVQKPYHDLSTQVTTSISGHRQPLDPFESKQV